MSKIFNIVKSPTSWGRKRRSPESIPPRTVLKPQSHWLVTVSWSLRAPEELSLWPTSTFRRTRGGRGLSCLSGQRRGFAAPGEDAVSFLDWKIIHISANSTTREQRRRLLGSIPPRRVWKSQPHWLVAASSRDPTQRGLHLWPASESRRARGG